MPENVGTPPATATGGSSGISIGTAAVLIGLAAAAAVIGTIILGPMAGGDEPPIRVRGGSIHLDLNNPDAKWEQVANSSDTWKIKGEPKRKKKDFYFDIVDPLSVCTGSKKGKGKSITLTHSDGPTVLIEVKSNKKTRVTGTGLSVSSDGQTLSLNNADGHLSGITIEGQQACSFTSKDQFKGMGLFDYN